MRSVVFESAFIFICSVMSVISKAYRTIRNYYGSVKHIETHVSLDHYLIKCNSKGAAIKMMKEIYGAHKETCKE